MAYSKVEAHAEISKLVEDFCEYEGADAGRDGYVRAADQVGRPGD